MLYQIVLFTMMNIVYQNICLRCTVKTYVVAHTKAKYM